MDPPVVLSEFGPETSMNKNLQDVVEEGPSPEAIKAQENKEGLDSGKFLSRPLDSCSDKLSRTR